MAFISTSEIFGRGAEGVSAADIVQQHHVQPLARGFFVVTHGGDDLIDVRPRLQVQPEGAAHPADALRTAGDRLSAAFGYARDMLHACRHRRAVRKLVMTDLFQRVAVCVSEIEQFALSALSFVMLHHQALDVYAGVNYLLYMFKKPLFVPVYLFQSFKERPVFYAAVFYHFAHAVSHVIRRQGVQNVRVDEHAGGLMESSRQVFPFRQIHAHFAAHGGSLYLLSQGGEIWTVGDVAQPPEGAQQEGPVAWVAEFADFTDGSPDKKGLFRLHIRLEVSEGGQVQAWAQVDSDGVWHPMGQPIGPTPKRSFQLPMVIRRGDHYRIKLTGTGACRIYSITRERYGGSAYNATPGRT